MHLALEACDCPGNRQGPLDRGGAQLDDGNGGVITAPHAASRTANATLPVNEPMLSSRWLLKYTDTASACLQEDTQLRHLVAERGKNWVIVAQHMEGRTFAQCLVRWRDHLDPSIRRDPWTVEEDRLLVTLQHHGTAWAEIANCLPGRYVAHTSSYGNRTRYCAASLRSVPPFPTRGTPSGAAHHCATPVSCCDRCLVCSTGMAVTNRWNCSLKPILTKVGRMRERSGMPPLITVEEKLAAIQQYMQLKATKRGGSASGPSGESGSGGAAAASGLSAPSAPLDCADALLDADVLYARWSPEEVRAVPHPRAVPRMVGGPPVPPRATCAVRARPPAGRRALRSGGAARRK